MPWAEQFSTWHFSKIAPECKRGVKMNNAIQSPKTTILGILVIAGALIHAATQFYQNQPIDMPTLFGGLSGGIGLIMAKDGSTHSTASEVGRATREAAPFGPTPPAEN
jgi:hypothetical protein